MIEKYTDIVKQHSDKYRQIKQHYNIISVVRILLILIVLGSVFLYVKSEQIFYIPIAIIGFFLFLILIKYHSKIGWKKKIAHTLIEINTSEIDFLQHQKYSSDAGEEFINTKHLYSYDLDLFGEKSLFQHLNRTALHIGKTTLAQRLTNAIPKEELVFHQKAIEELTPKISWRQRIYAIAKNIDDTAEKHQNLLDWTEKSETKLSKITLVLSYIVPILLLSVITVHFFVAIPKFYSVCIVLIFTNLFLTSFHTKRIKEILTYSENIDSLLKKYSLTLTEIETQHFENELLRKLHFSITTPQKASKEIHQLSVLFGNMDSFLNIFASPLFNGIFQYHIHQLHKLLLWKEQNSSRVKDWLQAIGEIETLNSLANFSYNNPEFTYPTFNNNAIFEFKEFGHPLIPKEKRITNDISFKEHPFVLLTGSNMSGKSTFLRTLGVNLVLGKTGAVVCAKQANIEPLELLVFMRLSDSLSENESYFFAEIKRLQQIAKTTQKKSCFILLDEILKGTNSNDKQNGTIEFIKKMVVNQAIGVIATHDLEVCQLTEKHSNYLTNKNFEVNIINNELIFDYKLQNGICQNQSASFLMKKMGVI
ncbi:MAG: DNA mismatch repair protein [Flavobacteriaceae bacterium]|nr:DNA mismatch repair protein [Flavobacteriaceae bacterium]